jgi:hypothetical protein
MGLTTPTFHRTTDWLEFSTDTYLDHRHPNWTLAEEMGDVVFVAARGVRSFTNTEGGRLLRRFKKAVEVAGCPGRAQGESQVRDAGSAKAGQAPTRGPARRAEGAGRARPGGSGGSVGERRRRGTAPRSATVGEPPLGSPKTIRG